MNRSIPIPCPSRAVRLTVLAGSLAGLAGCGAGASQDGWQAAPASPAARMNLGLADTALAGGMPRLALQVSQAVLAQHPRNVAALVRRGDAYYQLGDPAKAALSYRKALQVQPRSVTALLGLGRVALETDAAEASAHFTEALALDPSNTAALTDRGVAEDLLGSHAAAQSDYRQAIAQGGDATATQIDLALSLAMTGDPATAIRLLEPIATSPNASPKVREDLALALVLDGREREAATLLLGQMTQDQARQAIAGYRALQPGSAASARAADPAADEP